jgi:hemoglobin
VAARRRVHGDPRTLYGRGGGVFGLAKLADRLMDVWMENQLLNANQSVAKWHESQQKFGFKFLVTQLFGYLTGGPQRYTGQSMEAAHKHLGISAAEWNTFVADADRVFREFSLEQSVHQELLGIIEGFKEQCTVRADEAVPQDPGLCRKRPSGSTAYANLGGIYPIALYAHRLVDAVLQGPRALRVRYDTTGTRTPAALKYIVTELLANATGGPELVTAKDFEEAKLGIEVDQWDDFLNLANEVATVWPTPHHRELIARAIKAKKADFCMGLVDETGVSDARRNLAESGYGVIDQAAALDTCNGDAVQALEMLRAGWKPESQMRRSNSGSSLMSMDTDFSMDADYSLQAGVRSSQCPFSGNITAGAQTPACPFMRSTKKKIIGDYAIHS